jgi:micrococcal nuclease
LRPFLFENMETNNFYLYRALVTDVYDGDTVTLDIDLGFWTTLHNQKIRLYGINAPELKGNSRELGLVSKKWLERTLLGKHVILESIKDKSEKYGRILGILHLPSTLVQGGVETIQYLNINEQMIIEGFAERYLL